MAQSNYGQYPPYGHGQQPPHDPYANRRPLSYMQGDDNPHAVNGAPQYDYPSALPNRTNSTAARQNDEMFLPGQGPPPPPPRRNSQTASYNPQHYASPMASPTYNPGSPGLVRQPSFPNAQPAPYNPAAYSESSLHRVGSTAGYQPSFSPGYPPSNYQQGMSSPGLYQQGMSSPGLYQQGMPSPGLYQSQQPTRQTSMYSQQAHRPTVSTAPYSPSATQRTHYIAPPPLPAIPSAGSPTEDWGRLPTNNNHEATRYAPLRSRYAESDALTPDHHPTTTASPPVYGGARASPGSSLSNSLPPTPGPPPPPHGSFPTYGTNDAYNQSRPLPRVPSGTSSPRPGFYSSQSASRYEGRLTDAQHAQSDLENEISGMLASQSQSPSIQLNSQAMASNGEYLSDDTDPEATAGLEAMREAEKQEEEDAQRRLSGQRMSFGGWQQPSHQQVPTNQPPYPTDSDSDVPFVDLGSMGGGFDAHMSYGGDPNSLLIRQESTSDAHSRSFPPSSSGSLRRSGTHSEAETTYDEYGNLIHPFPPFLAARVDAVGTGGLADPTQFRNRRDSYDEGDDVSMQETAYPAPGEPPEMFYHPGITNRPLPPPPPNEMRHPHSSSFNGGHAPYPTELRSSSQVEFPRPGQPAYPAINTYFQAPPPGPNRHTSMVSHTNTPQTLAPIRAKTDAEERRRREQRASGAFTGEGSTPGSAGASAVALNLPTLEKKFNPAKLRPRDFDRCREPWALSNITAWLKVMSEGEQYLKKQPLIDGLVLLFTYKVHTLNIADAETLSANLIDGLQNSGALKQEEEWFLFTDEPVTGVVFQLTGIGCYSSKLHDYKSSLRCYSYHCQRTEKKIDLSSQPVLKTDEDWATYYKLKKEDTVKHDKKEVERQNILHELVQKEENYLRELDVLRGIYRDKLRTANPALIPPKKIETFLAQVFGKVDMVKRANEDHLLPQMKYRQKEQGPWVVGFSDILREWIRKAKVAYIDYASSYPNAVYKIRQEMERNMLFRSFLEKTQADPASRRLGWDHYLKVPITRLQQVGLLLDTVLKRSTQDNDEKRNLQIAIEEIKAVTHECDARVGEGQRKADLSDLQYKLKLRPGMQGRVELNLDHLGRELVHKGDVLRIGTNKFTWLETHAILFDHYLVLAKTIQEKTTTDASRYERYDVSRLPIPMDLLVLESRDDPPVIRSSLTGRAGVAKVQMADQRLQRVGSSQSSPAPGQLQHSNTSTSLVGLTTTKSNQGQPQGVTNLEGAKDNDKILYPFRIKHLGQETYTLYAYSEQSREDWCERIILAKTKHATALFAQNAEPFKLRVIADSAFAYEGAGVGGGSGKGITIKGTPLDRAIKEVEKLYKDKGRPGPACRSRVNCATAFMQPWGKGMWAVGTDYGVYISEMDNPRGWQRVINNPKVTQIAVLEDFSLFLLISDKSLIAYHLDVVCPVGGVPPSNDNSRRAPQKLSGSRDVGFFNTGKMKDRTLVFYKKRDVGLSSTFKVLEPVFQKSSEKKSRFGMGRVGKTEFFRDFDEFYIPTECMGMNMFHSSLAISSQKGFEVMTLDKKQPVSIPDLDAPHVAAISQKLAGQKPLGMFRLSDQEFLCVYEECAVYVNKHGDISRSVIMEFVGRAGAATVWGGFLIMFCGDFVEVRNAQNGRLRQVVWGRDVKCLDDGLQGGDGSPGGGAGGVAGARSVKLVMQHPEIEKVQIVVELVANEGLKE